MPWAFFQEPEEDDEAAALSVDWRAYSQTHTLSDKQQKLAEKIRKRENRIVALQKEVDKIRVRVRLAISTCCRHVRWCQASQEDLCHASGTL